MKYNWPDRIKFVLVNSLVNTIIGIAIALFMMSQEVTKKYFSNLREIFLAGIVTSALLTLPIFINEKNIKVSELHVSQDGKQLLWKSS